LLPVSGEAAGLTLVPCGNFSLESRTLLGLGGSGSESFLAGPRLTWAAFDLGRIRARIAAARSGAEATPADYEQTVLLALEDTENALFNFSQQRPRLIALEAARDASRTARHLSQLRFEAGVSDFMPVVDAERRVLEDERQQIRGQTAALTALVSVYKALGGGWEPFDGEG
jgi:multidrug efflux system outer membrane protein